MNFFSKPTVLLFSGKFSGKLTIKFFESIIPVIWLHPCCNLETTNEVRTFPLRTEFAIYYRMFFKGCNLHARLWISMSNSTDTSIWHMIHNLSRFVHINLFLDYESEAHKQLWTSTSGFSVCKNKIGLFWKSACKSEMNKKPMYWSGWHHGFIRLVESQTRIHPFFQHGCCMETISL